VKKYISVLSTTGLYLLLAQSVFATSGSVNICPTGNFNPLCAFSFSGNLIPGIISLLFIIALIIAVLYLIWGGIKWIMSGGDKAALQQAREHVIAAIVGLVVIFLTYFILNLVLNEFLGLNAGTFSLPSLR
jgi:hypothetical protein